MSDAQLTYTVQLDVSGGAFGSAFAGTDVTSKAVAGLGFEPVTVTWGRQDQYSDVSPTTVTGALLNTDGTFTPGNTGSSYYPRIKRGLRRRVSVGVNSTTVTLSEDYATALEVVPARDTAAVAQVEGSDILARFGQSTPLRSFLAEEMLVDAPSALYMMQEGEGATSFGDVTGTNPPLVVTDSKYGPGVVEAAQTPTGTFAAGNMVAITNANYGVDTSDAGSWLKSSASITAVSYSVEVWAQMPSSSPPGASGAIILELGAQNGMAPNARLVILSSGEVLYGINPGGTGVVTGPSLCDGQIHQFVMVNTSGVSSALYVDGVSVGTAAASSTTPAGLTVGAFDTGLGGGFSYFTGALAYLGVFPTALIGTRVTAHYNAGATAFAGLERTDQRVTRLLSYRPNTGSSLDTGLSTMGLQDIQGRTLQDCLLEVAQVEAGALYVNGLGGLAFRSRLRLFNPTPTVTLDMKAGGVDFGSNWREDTQNVRNDVTITNQTTGSDQRFTDPASITSDGEYAASTQRPVNSDADALNLAGWMVANGTRQQLTATPLIINLLHLTAAQAQAVLSLKPLDCLQLTNCPTPAPAATLTFIVQGGTTSLAADAATVTLNLTPMPEPVGVWDSTNWDATNATWAF